jgi:hypothetical protein
MILSRYYPAAAVKFYTFTGQWYVPESGQIGVMIYGATAADALSMVVNGVYER